MIDSKISQLTQYNTPLDADLFVVVDTANATTKKTTWAIIKSFIMGGGSTIEVTGTSATAVVNKRYIANNAALVTITLPTTASVGDKIEIVGEGAGGWKVAQNASQVIYFSNNNTTTGVGGSIESNHRRDCMTLVCVTANNEWQVITSVGTLTLI